MAASFRVYRLVPEDLFQLRWVCQVVRSGYHNGAGCTPSGPHGQPWDCRHRHEVSTTEPQFDGLATMTVWAGSD